MQEDIAALNRGQSRQEVLSNQVQTGVADVAEVDRTAELLLWLMDSFFGGVRLVAHCCHGCGYIRITKLSAPRYRGCSADSQKKNVC